MASGIYRIRAERGNKPLRFYIGQAKDLAERWKQHLRALRAGRHDNVPMQRAFRKYGESAFSFEILIICAPNKQIMCVYEQSVLDLYRTVAAVFNVMVECVNTHLGVKRRPETRERMSKSQIGRKKPPEEVEAMRQRQTGFKHTDEARLNMSVAQKNRVRSAAEMESFEKARKSPLRIPRLLAALPGRPPHSEETKLKIAAKLRGGKSTPEANAKKSAAMMGREWTIEEIERRVASRRARKSTRELAFAMDAI